MNRGFSIGDFRLAIGCRLAACVTLIAVPAFAQSGGGYVIKKSTIDSGGGTVTGGAYRLSGTVGQHDAGPISGGDYALTGGFWSPIETVSPPMSPTADPSGLGKTRFISFMVPGSEALERGNKALEPGNEVEDQMVNRQSTIANRQSTETALRVKLVSLHHVVPPYTGGLSVPFTSFEGQVRWVGPPTQFVESSSNPTAFHAASLQCMPHYQDWSTVGLMHVTGNAIVPSSVYEVENLAASCAGVEASCTAVSAPLEIRTTRWGDVEVPYNPPSITAQPDLGDIAALVNKFRSTPTAPIKARALLAGDDSFGNFSVQTMTNDFGFGHIAVCVDAFRGRPYPYAIAACP